MGRRGAGVLTIGLSLTFGLLLALYLCLSSYKDTVTNREVVGSPGRVTGVTTYDCPGLAHAQPRFFVIMEAPPERTPCARGRSTRTRVLVGGETATALGVLIGWQLGRRRVPLHDLSENETTSA